MAVLMKLGRKDDLKWRQHIQSLEPGTDTGCGRCRRVEKEATHRGGVGCYEA